jgi:transposase-like protein
MRQVSFHFMHKKRPTSRHAQEDKDGWVRMYQQGKSYREIAVAFDVPYPSVFYYVRKTLGITDGRKPGRKKKYTDLSPRQVQRNCQLRNSYGISLDEYAVLKESQGGVCAICELPPKNGKTSTSALHVDHDHETGRVRGLLCQKCNPALGQFNDDPDLLERAASYLRLHREAQKVAA